MQRKGPCASFVFMNDARPKEITALAQLLVSEYLPGWKAQSLACPPSRSPDEHSQLRSARRAGVMCIICPDHESNWSVVLIQRTEDDSPHSGQLAFPGGAQDPEDLGDDLTTARRECLEEVGVNIPSSDILGPLSPLYIPPSHFLVQPFVAWSRELLEFHLQAEEVAAVHLLPLRSLPGPGEPWPIQRISLRHGVMKAPGWPCGDQMLWGATAMMVAELNMACQMAGFGPSFATTINNRI